MSKRELRYCLHYGSAPRPLATVVPDAQWPGMWRIEWPDKSLSDMANLSRAKDAAEVIGANGRKSALLHWKRHGFDRPLEARTGDLAPAGDADGGADWIDWPPDEGGGA